MPPDSHIVVPLSATLVITVAAFVVGFLGNMLIIRSSFVSTKVCEECRTSCSRKNDSSREAIAASVEKIEKNQERFSECMFRMHGQVSEMFAKINTLRPRDKESDL